MLQSNIVRQNTSVSKRAARVSTLGRFDIVGKLRFKLFKFKMEWSNEKIIKFIEDYRQEETLWNIQLLSYTNNRIRKDLYARLAAKYGSGEEDIKKRIKNLRSAFHREHQRILNKKSGSSSERTKKWFAYESLLFLADVHEPRSGFSSTPAAAEETAEEASTQETTLEEDFKSDISGNVDGTITSNLEDNLEESNAGPARIPRDTRKRWKPMQTETERRAQEAYQILKTLQKRDECTIYGEYVGNELRQLSQTTQKYTKHMINNILFEASIGHLQHRPTCQHTTQATMSGPSSCTSRNTEPPSRCRC